jgi:death on curing protein
MRITLYPTLPEVLFLHEKLIESFGGSGGIRDLGLLESALHRPQSGYYKSLSEEAAALMQSLAQNHAFVDGNKRIAFAVTAIFLSMNGYRLKVDADNGESFLIGEVIQKKVSVEVIAGWIENHIKRTK